MANVAARVSPQISTSTFVQPLPPAARFILRGGPQVMAAAGNVLGLTISHRACRAATNSRLVAEPTLQATDETAGSTLSAPALAPLNHSLSALWLGPDEQLLIAPEDANLAALLEPALRDLPRSLVEVSHRQTALRVSGPQAIALLSAGCPLDLDPDAFPIGMCTRTVLAKAEIVLWRTARDVFHIEVWRSFAPYVSSFLAEVARELGA